MTAERPADVALWKRLVCLFRGHDWDGYQFNPLPLIRCRRCGIVP